MRTFRIGHAFGAALLGALATGGLAAAADDPANALKYRQSVMKAVGAHMGASAAIVKGEVGHGANHVQLHAAAIRDLAKLAPDAFRQKAGAEAGETAAKPAIWDNWAKFEQLAKALEVEAGKLADVAAKGDKAAIGQQLNALGDACGACHQDFREKKG